MNPDPDLEAREFESVDPGPFQTLHSKYPQAAPEGYIRVGYESKHPAPAQGPNYFYIRPEWVCQLKRNGSGGYLIWNPVHQDGKRRPHHGFGGDYYATIDTEGYTLIGSLFSRQLELFQ